MLRNIQKQRQCKLFGLMAVQKLRGHMFDPQQQPHYCTDVIHKLDVIHLRCIFGDKNKQNQKMFWVFINAPKPFALKLCVSGPRRHLLASDFIFLTSSGVGETSARSVPFPSLSISALLTGSSQTEATWIMERNV